MRPSIFEPENIHSSGLRFPVRIPGTASYGNHRGAAGAGIRIWQWSPLRRAWSIRLCMRRRQRCRWCRIQSKLPDLDGDRPHRGADGQGRHHGAEGICGQASWNCVRSGGARCFIWNISRRPECSLRDYEMPLERGHLRLLRRVEIREDSRLRFAGLRVRSV